MFGRDLVEQVDADAKGGDRQVPVIVEKCIEAVEVRGLSLSRISSGAGILIPHSSSGVRRNLPKNWWIRSDQSHHAHV